MSHQFRYILLKSQDQKFLLFNLETNGRSGLLNSIAETTEYVDDGKRYNLYALQEILKVYADIGIYLEPILYSDTLPTAQTHPELFI